MRPDQAERQLKLRELRILLAVVRAGSMAKAAAILSMSQPNVSKAISDLEHALGVNLLERSVRGVEATRYGVAVINRGVAIFDELRHVVEDVAFLADPTAGELRLGCVDWAVGWIGLAIDRISRRHSRITFDVKPAEPAALQRELKNRNIELFVAGIGGSISKENFDIEILHSDPVIIVADSRHPLCRRRSIELSELTDEAWVLPPKELVVTAYILDAFRKRELVLTNTVVNTYSAVLQHDLLATGRYIGILPSSMLQTRPSLKALPVRYLAMPRRIGIVVLKKRMLSPIARLFIDTLSAVTQPPTKARNIRKTAS